MRNTIIGAARIWLALAMVGVVMWLLLIGLAAIERAFDPHPESPTGPQRIIMPPL